MRSSPGRNAFQSLGSYTLSYPTKAPSAPFLLACHNPPLLPVTCNPRLERGTTPFPYLPPHPRNGHTRCCTPVTHSRSQSPFAQILPRIPTLPSAHNYTAWRSGRRSFVLRRVAISLAIRKRAWRRIRKGRPFPCARGGLACNGGMVLLTVVCCTDQQRDHCRKRRSGFLRLPCVCEVRREGTWTVTRHARARKGRIGLPCLMGTASGGGLLLSESDDVDAACVWIVRWGRVRVCDGHDALAAIVTLGIIESVLMNRDERIGRLMRRAPARPRYRSNVSRCASCSLFASKEHRRVYFHDGSFLNNGSHIASPLENPLCVAWDQAWSASPGNGSPGIQQPGFDAFA